MRYNALKYISQTRRARADRIREDGWHEASELMSRRRFGSAYRRMINACARAWRIECNLEPLMSMPRKAAAQPSVA